MIAARIDTPAPAPAQPQRPGQVRGGREGRPAPAFEEALKDKEAAFAAVGADLDPTADKPDVDGSAAPPPGEVATPAPVAPPIALDALIAQVLPQQQQQPQPQPPQQPQMEEPPPAPPQVQIRTQPQTQTRTRTQTAPNPDAPTPDSPQQIAAPRTGVRDTRRAPAGAADRHAWKADRASVSESPATLDADASEIATAPDAPAQRPTQARGPAPQEAPRASPKSFATIVAEQPDRTARAGRADQDGDPAPATRHVAVGKVTSATHFPVTADPVRQIATEVTRALESKSVAAAPEPQNAPVKTISIQLEPESLGAVTLRMRLSGDQLSVRVDVAEPATLELIQRERDRLQKSMATDTVSIDRLEIRAASDPTPVATGDNANAPKQDPNAPGQQSRHNATPQGGDTRRDSRGDSQPRFTQKNGQENDSARSDDSRGVYL